MREGEELRDALFTLEGLNDIDAALGRNIARMTMVNRDGSNKTEVQTAKRVLLWVALAARPLTVAELQYAVILDATNTDIVTRRVQPWEYLYNSCQGLIERNSDDTVRFLHRTVYEFLASHGRLQGKLEPASGHHTLAQACLRYLCSNNFAMGTATMETFDDQPDRFPFTSYACRYWASHFRECERHSKFMRPVLVNGALSFLKDDRRVDHCTKVLYIPDAVKLRFFKSHFKGLPIEKVSDRLRCSFTIEHRDPTGRSTFITGLHLASLFGFIDIAQRLLNMNMSPRQQDLERRTPLHMAALSGHKQIVKLLLEKGANPTIQDSAGWSALHCAVQLGHTEVVKALLEYDADFHPSPQHLSGRIEDLDVTARDGNTIPSWSWTSSDPLHIAAKRGHVEVLKLLMGTKRLEGGTRSPRIDPQTVRAFQIASQFKLGLSTIEYLLGLDPDLCQVVDSERRTPLHLAAKSGIAENVKVLIQQLPIEVNAVDSRGFTPVLYAAQSGSLETFQMLWERPEIDQTWTNVEGLTALGIAERLGHQAISELIQKGDHDETEASQVLIRSYSAQSDDGVSLTTGSTRSSVANTPTPGTFENTDLPELFIEDLSLKLESLNDAESEENR